MSEPLAPPDTAVPTYSPCLTRLREAYGKLTEAECQVADYLLQNPGKSFLLSIAELARVSNVGVATISRLCAKLGYGGYPNLKLALAVDLLSPGRSTPESIRDGDDGRDVIRKVVEFGARGLEDTLVLIDSSAVTRAAEAISRATRVEVYALGGISGPIALIAQHRLMMLGVPCAAFIEQRQQIQAASLLRPGDVAIGLSNSGEASATATALELARGNGAVTIGVTSAPLSSVAQAAEIQLLTANHQTWLWGDAVSSRIPALAVVDALYALVALRRYEASATPDTTPSDGRTVTAGRPGEVPMIEHPS